MARTPDPAPDPAPGQGASDHDASDHDAYNLRWDPPDHPLRRLFARMPGHGRHGVGLVVHDDEGRVVAANPDAVRVLALAWDQLVGRSPADPRWAAVDGSGLPLAEERHPVLAALRSGEPQRDVLVGVAVPDLDDAPHTRWLACTATPLRDPAGNTVVGATTTLQDVTTDPRGRAATDRALTLLRSLVGASSDAVVTVEDGTVTWAAPEISRILGWLPDALVGRAWASLLHPADRNRPASDGTAITPGGGATQRRARLRAADGGWRWVELSEQMQADAGGHAVAAVATIRDAQGAVEAESRAQLTETELRLLTDNVAAFVVRTTLDGLVTFASDAVSHVLGWDPAAVVGQSFLALLHRDDMAPVLQTVTAGLEGTQYEARFATAAGGHRWLRVTTRLVDDVVAGEQYVLASLVDIDGAVTARELLQEERDQARATVDSLLDAHAMVERRQPATGGAADWILVQVNRALCRWVGLPRESLVGRSVFTVVDAADRTRWQRWLDEADRTGSLVVDRVPAFGRDEQGERWFDVRGVRVGRRVSLTCRDVTASVREAQALAAAEVRYRVAAEHAGDVVLTTDADGVVTWVSPSVTETLGWLPEQVVGRPAGSIADPSVRADLERNESTVMASGRAVHGRTLLPCADGTRKWIRYLLRPVKDRDGAVVGRVSSLWDVDDQVRAEQDAAVDRQHLQQILEHAVDVILHLDGDGTLLWASPSLKTVFGYDPDDLAGRPFTLLTATETAAWTDEVRRLGEHRPAQQQRRFQTRRADGQPVWADAQLSFTWDRDGRLRDVVVGIRDATAEVEAHEALTTQLRNSTAMLDSLLDPHVLAAPIRDAAGRVVDLEYLAVNAAACAALGRDRGDLVGARLSDVVGDAAPGLLPYAAAALGGTPALLDDVPLPGLADDGRRFDVRAVAVDGVLSWTWRDVTDRHEREGRLAAAEERFRLLAEHASDVVLLVEDGRIAWASPSVRTAWGREPEELVGTAADSLVAAEHATTAAPVLSSGGAGTARATVLVRSASGDYRWVALTGTDVETSDGTPGRVVSARLVDEEVALRRELEATVGRFRLLAERAAQVTFRSGADGRCEWISPSVVDVLGWSVEDVVGTRATDFLHPDDRPLLERAELALLAGAAGEFEARFLTRDGGVRWIHSTGTPVHDDDGAVVGVVGSWRVVDEEVAARQRVAESEARYRLLAENASDVVYLTDTESRCQWISPSVTAVLGWSEADLLGRRMVELVHPDDLAAGEQARRAAVSDGQDRQVELRYRTKDGAWRWMSMVGHVVVDGASTVLGGVTALRAIDDLVLARDRLQDSERHFRDLAEQLRLVLDAAELGMWDWNMQTGETAFNERWAQILGYELSDLAPLSIETWVDLAHPDDLADSDARIAAHDRGETEYYELECRMRHRDGHWVWVRDRGRIVERSPDGRALRMVGTHEDITALRASRAVREAAEERLRSILDATVSGLVIHAADGSIVGCNRAAERMLGLTHDQLLDRTSIDPRWRAVHLDGSPFPGEEHPAMVALATGRPQTGQVMGVHRPDGTLVWLGIDAAPYDDPEKPDRTGVVASFSDITETVSAGQELATSEERFRLLAESMSDVVEQFDPDWRRLWVSPSVERVLGHTAADQLGGFGPSSVHPEDIDAALAAIGSVVASGGPGCVQRVRRRHANGSWRWVDATLSFRYDATGALAATYVTSHDVQSQVEAEERLAASQQRFRRMFTGHAAVMLLVDPADGAIVDANVAAARFYGHPVEVLRTMRLDQVVTADPAPGGELAAAATGGDGDERGSRVFSHRLADGTVRTVEVHSSPIDDGGRHLLFSIVRDISEEQTARDALARSEEQFRVLAESAQDVVVTFDSDYAATWVSPSVRTVLGFEPEELLRRPLPSLIHPDDRFEPPTPGAAVRDGTVPLPQWRARFRDARGGHRWMESNASVRFDDDGRLLGGQAVMRDIEAQVRAEEELQESRRHYRMLAENSGDVVLLLSSQGRVTWASPAVQRLTGWPPEQLLGIATSAMTHPDDLPAVQAGRLEVLDGGTATFQARIRRRDGAWQWTTVVSRAVQDARGEVTGIVTNWRDATADVAARLAMEASEARFRVAMATAPIPTMLLDLDLRINEANDAVTTMLGYEREDLLRLGLADLAEDPATVGDLPLSGLVSGALDVATVEYSWRTRDGGQRWGQLSVTLVRNDHAAPSHYIAQVMDLTAVREAQEQLAWQATHDPLTGIANRAAFDRALERAQERHLRQAAPLAVLYCDVDRFKEVNDRHGHDSGDRLLSAIAARLVHGCRASDTVARLGGDEFVVIAEQVRSPEEVSELADRLLQHVGRPVTLPDGTAVTPGMSIGIAIAGAGETRRELLKRADLALYDAKASGRGRWALRVAPRQDEGADDPSEAVEEPTSTRQ